MSVLVDGLEPRDGETAFAFFVLRLHAAVERDGLLDVLRAVAPLIPDVDAFIDELPEDLDGRLQILAIPWTAPDSAAGALEQRAIVESAAAVGVQAAWFFQTGSRPQRALSVRFPIDNYPSIVESYDWEDFGIAVKLAGDELAGENTVLLAFHTLWLAPYGDRFRNSAVTIDRDHHSAHLWVDRFAVQVPSDELVHHLLWIAAMLDRVLPVMHARFAAKHGRLVDGRDLLPAGSAAAGRRGEIDDDAPFVLGGNPLRARYREGREQAVEAWIAGDERAWSDLEVAQMLRELAIEIANGDQVETGSDRDDAREDADDDDDDGTDRGRHITRYAGELLAARARSGQLDRRTLDALLPMLPQRRPVIELAAALGDRAAIPALVGVLGTPASPFVAAAATALASIGDPAAAPVLAAVMASDAHPAGARIAAATALAYGPLAAALPVERRVEAARAIAELTDSPLAAAAAAALDGAVGPELAPLLHVELTTLAGDHDTTVRRLRAALGIAAALPDHVRAEDLEWLTRFAEHDLRTAAHAVLEQLGASLPPAPAYDAAAARALDDIALIRAIAEPHVIGRGVLIDEVGRRRLPGARRPIVGACSEVIARARPDTARLLDHDARVLEAAVPVLRTALDDDAVALFDRMLRNSNIHVKWDLLQEPPIDARLIGGMFHVLGERWGWQELAAKRWLSRFQGTDAYELERRRGRVADDDEDIN